MLPHRLQGVWIEEAVALERDTADKTVVESALQYIVVFRVTVKQEESVVHIHITNGGTGLAVCTHIGQFVVLAEGLAIRSGADTASDIELFGDDIVPDGIDGLDIVFVTCEGGYIGHTCIHIGSTNGMSYGFVLLDDGLMSLRIVMYDGGLTTVIEEELSFVEIFLFASNKIQFGKCHLCDLMPRNHTSLTRVRADLTADTVGITDGDVEELTAACGLIVGDSTFHHVAEVVELVTQVLFLTPAFVASPLVGFLWILGA